MLQQTTTLGGRVAATPAESLKMSPQVEAKVRGLRRSLSCAQVAEMVWIRELTEEQRAVLGGDLAAASGGGGEALRMWMRFHRCWEPRAVVRLSRAVNLLFETDYRWLERELASFDPTVSAARRRAGAARHAPVPDDEEPDGEDLIQEAVAQHRLVLVSAPPTRRVYWRGKCIAGRWRQGSAQWDLLRLLAGGAAGGTRRAPRGVAWDMVNRSSPDAIVDRRSRLKKMLPCELDNLIVTTKGKRNVSAEPAAKRGEAARSRPKTPGSLMRRGIKQAQPALRESGLTTFGDCACPMSSINITPAAGLRPLWNFSRRCEAELRADLRRLICRRRAMRRDF